MEHNKPSKENIVIAQKALHSLKQQGIQHADILICETQTLNASARMGKPEDVEHSESLEIGLRAIIDQKQAFVSGTVLQPEEIETLAQRVADMAKNAPQDPYCGLGDANLLCTEFIDLELNDLTTPNLDTLQNLTLETESIARDTKGIINSEGASASWGRATTHLITSHGFTGSDISSSWSLSCCVLGGEKGKMERDYASHTTRHKENLDTPKSVGERAANRTLKRLNARKVKSQNLPVIFDSRVSSSLLNHFASAISGGSITRKSSFLQSALQTQVFSDSINISDNPLLKRGLRSSTFDDEGLGQKEIELVDNGVLKTWLLDSSTAKQLNLTSNARASRGIGTPPSPSVSNLYMHNGQKTVAELCKDIGTGVYITELIGMGVNVLTGDYSRGASGYWIENGQIAYPISEITIASNLKDMFANLIPANDLQFRHGINAPSILIEMMALAGL